MVHLKEAEVVGRVGFVEPATVQSIHGSAFTPVELRSLVSLCRICIQHKRYFVNIVNTSISLHNRIIVCTVVFPIVSRSSPSALGNPSSLFLYQFYQLKVSRFECLPFSVIKSWNGLFK